MGIWPFSKILIGMVLLHVSSSFCLSDLPEAKFGAKSAVTFPFTYICTLQCTSFNSNIYIKIYTDASKKQFILLLLISIKPFNKDTVSKPHTLYANRSAGTGLSMKF